MLSREGCVLSQCPRNIVLKLFLKIKKCSFPAFQYVVSFSREICRIKAKEVVSIVKVKVAQACQSLCDPMDYTIAN